MLENVNHLAAHADDEERHDEIRTGRREVGRHGVIGIDLDSKIIVEIGGYSCQHQ